MYYVYVIQNLLNKKIYIGKTNNTSIRWNHHLIYAKGGKEKYPAQYQYLHRSINKYGENNFDFSIIENYDLELDCLEAEQFWIQFFRSWDPNYGYNLTMGGEGSSGRFMSEETKDKIRTKAIGRLHTTETKNKISKAGKLRINSPETRNKISLSNKGRKLTKEQNIANSERQLGKILPASQIENMKKSAKRGENSVRAKLTNKQVTEIRKLFATQNFKIKELAKIYGISVSAMSYIVNNKTYK